MGPLGRRCLAMLEQPLASILPERLEHREPRVAIVRRALHQKAVVDERGDALQDVDAEILAGIAHRFGALERAASGKHRQAAKERLLR